ncbi:hypothetical protein [Arsenicibacter rosenii]|uniref:Uncharacterized protein n=1 Tax=Arsenicibacter rosenii TaxID=1750698 RepID=A0A1S2VB55_9BACT|nr:hypothetical protein [Arsenicibacter rosenii]OIN55933.1 hypothetical protein BLX24_27210 [Arsenicibacter rosenii]
MDKLAQKYTHINGWGIDIDPKNDPTYPIKKRTNEEQEGYTWQRPAQQQSHVEVLHSIERPNLSATFGTSVPPRGLSGQLRRYAFKYSESHYGHWLPLLLADRVAAVEGIVADLKQGRIPDFFAEKGRKAEWKYNPQRVVIRVAVTVAVATAAWAFFNSKRKGHE